MNNIQIPKFDEFLAPILRYCSDGKEHSLLETIEKMASEFKLTDEQKNALMPNGMRTYLYDRVAWAITYLVEAGLLERTGRSKFKITDLGLSEIKNLPDKITYKYLEKFESYRKFKERRHKTENENDSYDMTPDEEIDDLFKIRNETLINNILSQISNIKPSDFEKLVIDVILALGYGKDNEEMAKALGGPKDQGIDGVIFQDKLGFEKIYIQAKKWNKKTNVGSNEIRNFIGALDEKKAQKGIFITTSSFTKEAIETAKNATTKIVLIDGRQLAELMIKYGIGVKTIQRYELKELDEDYFESFQ